MSRITAFLLVALGPYVMAHVGVGQSDGLTEALRGLVRDSYPLADSSRQTAYVLRLSKCIEAFTDAEERGLALDRVAHYTQLGGFTLDSLDLFREQAALHPELEVLVLPKTYYLRCYDHSIRIAEVELARALATPPLSVREQEAIHSQLESLRQQTYGSLEHKFTGEFAQEFVTNNIADRINSLQEAIGDRFWGVNSLLSEHQELQILREIEQAAQSIPVTSIDRQELTDPQLAYRAVGRARRSGRDIDPSLLKKTNALRNLLQKTLEPLGSVYARNYPGVTSAYSKLEALEAEAAEWMKTSKSDHLSTYVRIVGQEMKRDAKERLIQERSLVEEKRQARGRSSDLANDPSPGSTISAVVSGTVSAPERADADTTNHTGRNWVIVLGLAALGVLMAVTLKHRGKRSTN